MSNETSSIPPGRKYSLKKAASKSRVTAALLGFLISPLGYYYVGRTGLALVNLLTLNYFLVGFLVVPLHTWFIIGNARDELDADQWDI